MIVDKILGFLSEQDAVISALLAIFVTYYFTVRRDRNLESAQRNVDANYAAIKLICILDEFIFRCVDVVHDDGRYMGQRNSEGHLEPQEKTPQFEPESIGIDFRCLEASVAYKILYLPNKIKVADEKISFIANAIACPPDYDEFFEARHESYLELGLYALEISTTLRKTFDLGDFENPYSQHPRITFNEKYNEIKERNKARELRMDASNETME